jgi:hypothetical protein
MLLGLCFVILVLFYTGVEILNCVKKMKILIDDLTSTSSGGEAFGEE